MSELRSWSAGDPEPTDRPKVRDSSPGEGFTWQTPFERNGLWGNEIGQWMRWGQLVSAYGPLVEVLPETPTPAVHQGKTPEEYGITVEVPAVPVSVVQDDTPETVKVAPGRALGRIAGAVTMFQLNFRLLTDPAVAENERSEASVNSIYFFTYVTLLEEIRRADPVRAEQLAVWIDASLEDGGAGEVAEQWRQELANGQRITLPAREGTQG